MSDSDNESYNYEDDMSEASFDEHGDSTHEASISISYENALNNLVVKHRKLVSDKSVSVSIEEMHLVVEEFIKEVADILHLNRDSALSLLIHFHWNKEILQEKYFDNPDKVLIDAGIPLSPAVKSSVALPLLCKICDSQVQDIHGFVQLPCSHTSCSDCFSQYLHHRVHDGSGCIKSNCLEYKCKSLIPTSTFEKSLEPEDYARYHRFVAEDFIKFCSRLKWCTSPKCGLVIVTTTSNVKSVRCLCSQCTCFQCGEESHEPASCEQTKQWLEKCSEDFPTKKWILLNTKNCPYCKEAIEKNQGCNHMTCKACSNHFCWICLGKWSEHNDNYRCNKPVEQAPGLTSEKLELERYVHFFERYHGHGKGMDYAHEQAERMKSRLELLDSHSKHEIDFLQQAIKVLDTVVDCRRVLKYTYVMGCFLDQNDPKIQLFQHQQEMLEKNTEQLSHYTETKTFTESVLNTQMVNLKGVTEHFKTLLLQSMEDGRLLDTADKF